MFLKLTIAATLVAAGLAAATLPASAFHPCGPEGGVCGKDHFPSPYDYPSYAGPSVGRYGWAPVAGEARWVGRRPCGGRCDGAYGGSSYGGSSVTVDEYRGRTRIRERTRIYFRIRRYD